MSGTITVVGNSDGLCAYCHKNQAEYKITDDASICGPCREPEYRDAVRRLRRESNKSIYFIQDTVGGQIKIGWATTPSSRLGSLQGGNPNQLQMLGTMAGGNQKERELHRQFGHLRLLGEWFEPGDDLLAFIKENCK